jgi:threonine aldolase
MAISITQATEIGTLYQPDEITAIAGVAQTSDTQTSRILI